MTNVPPALPFASKSYERKFIAFFDVLGWRDAIANAGNDPAAVGRLGLIVDIFSAKFVSDSAKAEGVRLSSFSDNVVVTFPYDPDTMAYRLRALATIQAGVAVLGFWLRGSVTIGDIYHSDASVFGPGLVRAHYLESKCAVVPRILIDPVVASAANLNDVPVVTEQDRTFVDPFTPAFIDEALVSAVEATNFDAFNAMFGATLAPPPVAASGLSSLARILSTISDQIGQTNDPRAWTNLAWLFDRIAPRLRSKATAAILPSPVTNKTIFVEPAIV